MGKVIIVAGDSGTGKSTSIKTLNAEETFLINVLGKPLPFKGSEKQYTDTNSICVLDYKDVVAVIEAVNKKSNIKFLIIDDIGFVMQEEFFARSAESGFTKFSDVGVHMQKIVKTANSCRADLNIALMFHDDDETNPNKTLTKKKLKTIGNLLEDKYNPLATVSVCLFTDVEFDKNGVASYNFITNRTLVKGVETPAKSPQGMFSELKIPNDLNLVFTKMNEYYN